MSNREIERRFVRSVARVETRASVSGGGNLGITFTGRAIVYDAYSRNLGGFVERVRAGFIAQTLRDGADVLARREHDSDMLLGRTSAGTLDLRDGPEGLDYDVPLPDTSYARDLAALAERGDIRNSSFAFRMMPDGDEWSLTEQGTPLRTLLPGGGALVDVSPVTSPAYPDATSGLRSLAEQRGLDLDTVRAAAAAHELGVLLREQAPTVIDLGSSQTSECPEQDATPGPTQVDPAPALAIARRRFALAQRLHGNT